MALLNTADKIYIGSTLVTKVYLGTTLVWPPPAQPMTRTLAAQRAGLVSVVIVDDGSGKTVIIR